MKLCIRMLEIHVDPLLSISIQFETICSMQNMTFIGVPSHVHEAINRAAKGSVRLQRDSMVCPFGRRGSCMMILSCHDYWIGLKETLTGNHDFGQLSLGFPAIFFRYANSDNDASLSLQLSSSNLLMLH